MPQSSLRRAAALPLPFVVFLTVRLSILLATPYDGLHGYGDFVSFFNTASLPGWPYFHSWAEFPPIFAFISKLLYLVSGGVEHVYTYLLIFLLFLADLGSLWLFIHLRQVLNMRVSAVPAKTDPSTILFAAILAGLPYTWWYFDGLVVFLTLLALYLLLTQRAAVLIGAVLGVGILTKLFPALLLPAIWRSQSPRRAAVITAVALALTMVVYGSLWAVSPAFTRASLQSQSAKGSWETVWALLDGNSKTGNFGPTQERLDPAAATLPRGNPALINSAITLLVFAALGLLLYLKTGPLTNASMLSFAGLTWAIFFLWSPGWSPQWLLYLIPLILLSLPERTAPLLAIVFLFINLLEWPILLSRGLFQTLPLTILLRTLIFILLAILWYQQLHSFKNRKIAA